MCATTKFRAYCLDCRAVSARRYSRIQRPVRGGAAMLTRGFTVIEVLVTLVILMFGLMGIAGLMAKGQRAAFEAFQRQTALTYAVSIAERIRSNRLQASAYAGAAPLATPSGRGTQYQDYLDHNVTDCGSTNCSQAALATYDISMWDGLLSGFTEQQAAAAAVMVMSAASSGHGGASSNCRIRALRAPPRLRLPFPLREPFRSASPGRANGHFRYRRHPPAVRAFTALATISGG